ncbi:hypothetical protein TNIN_27521 [Trichonephila inaurata madagascariensis]|uniref:Uncharacterized protein n=1 Tax=Trichonephila inaurata madagascariensis TaxID=2747483 RepID=A0A8X6YHC4_9ARAC|nr:hypothetical protein TNIN_27521 [Trichonephila inaurata madagascariensis]
MSSYESSIPRRVLECCERSLAKKSGKELFFHLSEQMTSFAAKTNAFNGFVANSFPRGAGVNRVTGNVARCSSNHSEMDALNGLKRTRPVIVFVRFSSCLNGRPSVFLKDPSFKESLLHFPKHGR